MCLRWRTLAQSTLAIGYLFSLSTTGTAQERAGSNGSRDVQAPAAEVQEEFAYQGQLTLDGSPVTGAIDMIFQLFSDATCLTPEAGETAVTDLSVVNGIFNLNIPSASEDVNGQQLWLRMEVEGSYVGCEEIRAVPYAIGIRPGARIVGSQVNWDVLHVENTATTGESYGVWVQTDASLGRGVSAHASASSGTTYGVYARSDSPEGVGVYARGKDDGADLVLGGNADTGTGDDGKIYSDPNYASSDIYLISNDTIRLDLNEDNDAEDGDFEIRAGNDANIFNVDDSGAVSFGRLGVAAFPRPAYDTDWVTMTAGTEITRNHNLGGSADRYVVDLICKDASGVGVNNLGVGRDIEGAQIQGASWTELTGTSIKIRRWLSDDNCPSVRLRIWMYAE